MAIIGDRRLRMESRDGLSPSSSRARKGRRSFYSVLIIQFACLIISAELSFTVLNTSGLCRVGLTLVCGSAHARNGH